VDATFRMRPAFSLSIMPADKARQVGESRDVELDLAQTFFQIVLGE
jgi:hypothetical protein